MTSVKACSFFKPREWAGHDSEQAVANTFAEQRGTSYEVYIFSD